VVFSREKSEPHQFAGNGSLRRTDESGSTALRYPGGQAEENVAIQVRPKLPIGQCSGACRKISLTIKAMKALRTSFLVVFTKK